MRIMSTLFRSDRSKLYEHLAIAEEHVAAAERSLVRQRGIVAELERDGRNTAQALALLAYFEEVQAMHIAERDRLLRELPL
jgi:GTP cyclohydrolase II